MNRNTKLIVPVIALVICAGAMVGIGYAALSTDYTTEGNSITGNVFEVGPNGTKNITFSAAVPYETHTVVSEKTTTKTYTVNNGSDGTTIDLTGTETIKITDSTSLGYKSYNVKVELTNFDITDKDENAATYTVSFSAPSGQKVTDGTDGHSATVSRAASGDTTLSFDITADFAGMTFNESGQAGSIDQLTNNGLTLRITVTGITG